MAAIVILIVTVQNICHAYVPSFLCVMDNERLRILSFPSPAL